MLPSASDGFSKLLSLNPASPFGWMILAWLGNLFVGSSITSKPAALILSADPDATVSAARCKPLALGNASRICLDASQEQQL